MIRNTSDTMRLTFEAVNKTAEVFMQTWKIRGRDERLPALRPEDQVIMQAEIGGHVSN